MSAARAVRVARFRIAGAGMLVIALTLAAFAAGSSDAPAPAPHTRTSTADVPAATRDYLGRRAALLLIRAMFDVLPRTAVADQLGQDLVALGRDGPQEADQRALDDDLLAEGSYLIVSLRYLVQGGGALWPPDEAQQSYEDDAFRKLRVLQSSWSQVVATRGDPLPVLIELDRLYALTEGYAAIPPELDHFSDRDALVTEVTARSKARVDL
jgi:hypothetical protein